MRYVVSAATTLVLSLVVLIPNLSAQETSPSAAKAKAATKGAEESPDAVAIREASAAFVEAFNKKDAKAVVEFWTPDGEYIDDEGNIFKGREAIEKGYTQFFKANPAAKLKLAVGSIRVLTAGAAIEDGEAAVEPALPGPSGINRYTAVHVKVDGKWRMASLRDTFEETASAFDNVADLEWLIGNWVAEEHGARSESTCRWIAGKNFVERQYNTKHADGTTASGVQIIGWDPLSSAIRSWNFSPDGGFASGIWAPIEAGWQAEVQGAASDGTPSSAVNILKRLDDNAYSWQSVQRTLGDEAVPDTDEVIIKRQQVVTAKK